MMLALAVPFSVAAGSCAAHDGLLIGADEVLQIEDDVVLADPCGITVHGAIIAVAGSGASITLESAGDVLVSGRLVAGSGLAGTAARDDAGPLRGLDGFDGGSITLRGAEVRVDQWATLVAGSGGAGGDARLDSGLALVPGHRLAVGGDGGAGGRIIMEATSTAPIVLGDVRSGAGGPGGAAMVVGGGHAIGGQGGDALGARAEGMFLEQILRLSVGAVGGNGGPAFASYSALELFGEPGDPDKATDCEAPEQALLLLAGFMSADSGPLDNTADGGDGGFGVIQGGEGGSAEAEGCPGLTGPTGKFGKDGRYCSINCIDEIPACYPQHGLAIWYCPATDGKKPTDGGGNGGDGTANGGNGGGSVVSGGNGGEAGGTGGIGGPGGPGGKGGTDSSPCYPGGDGGDGGTGGTGGTGSGHGGDGGDVFLSLGKPGAGGVGSGAYGERGTGGGGGSQGGAGVGGGGGPVSCSAGTSRMGNQGNAGQPGGQSASTGDGGERGQMTLGDLLDDLVGPSCLDAAAFELFIAGLIIGDIPADPCTTVGYVHDECFSNDEEPGVCGVYPDLGCLYHKSDASACDPIIHVGSPCSYLGSRCEILETPSCGQESSAKAFAPCLLAGGVQELVA